MFPKQRQNLILCLVLMMSASFAQTKRTPASLGRADYVEVEPKVKLHVIDMGEGPPVVFIHGWPLSNAMFEYQYSMLTRNGYRVIGISLRGFGLSDKPYGKYDFDVHADDIKVILEKLKIENAVLCGFSMGGAISIRYMDRHKGAHVTKLALFGAPAPIWTRRPDFPFSHTVESVSQMINLNETDRPQLLEDFGKIFASTQTALSEGEVHWLTSMNDQASPYAMGQSLIALRDTDLREDLKTITVPTAIFHARQDKICSFTLAEQMKKLLTNAHIIAFETGHAFFIEERERFNDELLKFVKQ